MTKNRLIQTVLVAVLAICTLGSAFVSILACMPNSTDVEIRETIHASASRLSAGLNPDYQVDIMGELRNTTEKTIVVERLEIPLQTEAGDASTTVVLENIIIPARATQILPSASEIMDNAYVKVGEITATIGGEEVFLRNPAEVSLTASLIPLAITCVLGFLLVRACKTRYYMYQEDHAPVPAQEESTEPAKAQTEED